MCTHRRQGARAALRTKARREERQRLASQGRELARALGRAAGSGFCRVGCGACACLRWRLPPFGPFFLGGGGRGSEVASWERDIRIKDLRRAMEVGKARGTGGRGRAAETFLSK